MNGIEKTFRLIARKLYYAGIEDSFGKLFQLTKHCCLLLLLLLLMVVKRIKLPDLKTSESPV